MQSVYLRLKFPGMKLEEVTDKRTEKLFFKVPRIIYKNDPNWIPHLRQDIEKVFDPKRNKLFSGGEAIRWVLVDDGGNPIGRIAAFINPKTAHEQEQPTGGMGFFESIDNQDAANMLLEAARKWLAERDMEAMDGPVNFGERNQFWGCLIENFTDQSSYGMNYNPPWYPKLLENYGFQIYFKQLCFKRDVYVPIQPVFRRKYRYLQSTGDFEVRTVRGMDLDVVAEHFREVYNGAWGGHAGFKEMTAEGAQKIMKSLKPVLDPDIIVFAYNKDRPIGFYVNIPELNDIFQYVDGNLNWLGKLKFLYHKWRGTPRTMVGIVFGVVRDFHGQGVEGAMISYTGDNIVPNDNYFETVLTWIGDFNPKMLKVAENLGGWQYRTLATYRYLFDRSRPFKRCPIAD